MTKYKGVSTLEILEGAKRYNQWIAEQFTPFVKYPLLEIGSGTGNLSIFFAKKGKTVLSDIDQALVTTLKKRFAKISSISIKKLDIAGQISVHENNSYQTIIAVNVMEHIKNDTKAFNNMYRILKRNGKLLLLVPAKQLAYTQFDKKLGHVRRYEKNDLSIKLQKAGFTIRKLYFFNIVGLLSWIVRDKFERGNQIKAYQIALFDLTVPFLKIFERVIKPPVGISLIAIAEKV